ncbi:conserved hypothetical protein [Methylobacterium sp. 4-46]|uniref:hypothetical protein n=1 Tax=unclassified Methylobacterium TaxID=2615210 RepID=UPI000165CD61|nr:MULTISPECIES: hypothetical protein [Methylobacterium]ACA20095.1 conserved hypothetical protein [Methylobacterium sp. 4-46]WFT79280.1 hypothetical protein QA634_29310 [Methylobacterium nodulans]
MPRPLLLLVAAGLAGPAAAQTAREAPLTLRVRPEAAARQDVYARAAARGPVVLRVDPFAVPSGAPLVAVRAVPVAHVQNGGAFGPTGFGYYDDQISEGPLNRRPRPAAYVLGSVPY